MMVSFEIINIFWGLRASPSAAAKGPGESTQLSNPNNGFGGVESEHKNPRQLFASDFAVHRSRVHPQRRRKRADTKKKEGLRIHVLCNGAMVTRGKNVHQM